MSIANLRIFDYSRQQMNWLASRQKLISTNIAHSDTPGYKGKDLVPLNLKGSMIKGNALSLRPSEHDTTLKKGLLSGPLKTQVIHNNEQRLSGNNIILEDQLKLANETGILHHQVTSIYKEYSNLFGSIF